MKTILLSCLALAAVTLTAGPLLAQDAPSVPIGVVDIQRAIRGVEDGQQAIQNLERQLQQRQNLLDQSESELRQFTQQLEQDLVMLDTETRRQRLAEYQERLEAYQNLYLTHQRELLQLEQEATREIVGRMVDLVAQIAADRNLAVVLERTQSSVVFAATQLDLTDELISRYEQQY
ncbi:MAG: OmpH family outer membrane protein [Bradymonadales bacterium]|nr:OmpH family outer membrane protein [Bradymonadales bacterium]